MNGDVSEGVSMPLRGGMPRCSGATRYAPGACAPTQSEGTGALTGPCCRDLSKEQVICREYSISLRGGARLLAAQRDRDGAGCAEVCQPLRFHRTKEIDLRFPKSTIYGALSQVGGHGRLSCTVR